MLSPWPSPACWYRVSSCSDRSLILFAMSMSTGLPPRPRARRLHVRRVERFGAAAAIMAMNMDRTERAQTRGPSGEEQQNATPNEPEPAAAETATADERPLPLVAVQRVAEGAGEVLRPALIAGERIADLGQPVA